MSAKRVELEKVATEAVQKKGLHNLSFRTLAEEVGVKSSSVHYYFPEKANLAQALINQYTETFLTQLEAIDEQHDSLEAKLKAFINIFDRVLADDKLCLCGMMSAEVATLDETSRQSLIAYFQHAENWLSTAFDRHQAEINSDMTPKTLARIVVSGLEGAILVDRVEASRHRLQAQEALIHSWLA